MSNNFFNNILPGLARRLVQSKASGPSYVATVQELIQTLIVWYSS